jgi:hypothetical protein
MDLFRKRLAHPVGNVDTSVIAAADGISWPRSDELQENDAEAVHVGFASQLTGLQIPALHACSQQWVYASTTVLFINTN